MSRLTKYEKNVFSAGINWMGSGLSNKRTKELAKAFAELILKTKTGNELVQKYCNKERKTTK